MKTLSHLVCLFFSVCTNGRVIRDGFFLAHSHQKNIYSGIICLVWTRHCCYFYVSGLENLSISQLGRRSLLFYRFRGIKYGNTLKLKSVNLCVTLIIVRRLEVVGARIYFTVSCLVLCFRIHVIGFLCLVAFVTRYFICILLYIRFAYNLFRK